MQTYWLKFTDGTDGYCEGMSAHHALTIAEKLTGKTVAVEPENKYQLAKSEAIKPNPYPVTGMIWQFDDPVYGVTPPFCWKRGSCVGRTACPQSYSCTE